MQKKNMISIFVCMLLLIITLLPVAATMNMDKKEAKRADIYPNPSRGILVDPGDVLFDYDVETPTGDNQCLGVEFDGMYFYVTGGGAGGTNKLHFFEADGTYITSIDQGTTSSWGWRDMAYDGNHMYSGDENGLKEWYVTGLPSSPVLTVVGTIPAPISPCRALTYNPATDHFLATNFGSPLYEFDRSGTIINIFTNISLNISGLAWDDASPDGSWLWIYSRDGTPPVLISQFDPINGILTGVTYLGVYHSPTPSAGGAAFIEDWDGIGAFVGLTQDVSDLIFGIEIFITNQPPGAPSITGPTSGKAGTSYDYDFTATDPDGDDIWYFIEWGDGFCEDWIGPYSSGQEITVSYTWDEEDTYTIAAKAQDEYGLESDWATLEVVMPVNQQVINPLLQMILERFPNAFPILRYLLGL